MTCVVQKSAAADVSMHLRCLKTALYHVYSYFVLKILYLHEMLIKFNTAVFCASSCKINVGYKK